MCNMNAILETGTAASKLVSKPGLGKLLDLVLANPQTNADAYTTTSIALANRIADPIEACPGNPLVL